MKHTLIISLFSLSLLTGCEPDPAQVAAAGQPSFRVRSDFAAGLNTDEGWAGALNENVTIQADQPFRVRFEVERAPGSSGSWQFRLQYRRNGGDWTDVEAHDFPHPETDDAKTPRVSIVSCAAYRNGEATTNVLPGSSAGFQAGTGVALVDRTSGWNGAGTHTEFEWPLVVRRFADGAVTNDESDTFELRMVEAGGAAMGNYRNPVLRLAIPPRHVGGTFVETPGRIGPFQASNGHLYFIMEPTETDNLFMMIKSTDGGLTWREVDGANRPATDDLESVDARQVGDTIHILHQVTRSARYHSFRTSEHPTNPDSWATRDELAASANSVAQAATLVVRSDGSMTAFYVGQTVHYNIRSAAGVWGTQTIIDAGVAPNLAGPRAVLGANDTVHLAYYGTDGTIWYRRLLPDGTLTPREQLASGAGTTRAEYGAVLPLVYIPEANTVVVIYRLASGRLWERRIVNDGPPTAAVQVTDRDVVTDAVDSQQPGADAVLDGKTVHVFFIEKSSRSIFSTHDNGGWQPSTLRVDKILGSWIRGNIYNRRDEARVYGYVYDAGSDGGAGMNRFSEVVLSGR
ncbi:MAG: exo-alpha-sialidase [Acidobacteria bacterium]|nr:MAG: exo-alpha-sialidase [Acidobacteriota bacterium]